MNTKEYNILYDRLFEMTQRILQHYQCPDCGSCCKNHIVSFSRKEYIEISKNISDQNLMVLKDNVEKTDIKGIYRIIKKHICPFIYNQKCEIYNNRPECCKKYPFEFFKTNATIIVHLVICPLSINIIHDLAEFYSSMSNEKSIYYGILYKQFQDIKENKDDYRIMLGDSVLEHFESFLERREKNDNYTKT
jgi:Fe-S-cluster containining protein